MSLEEAPIVHGIISCAQSSVERIDFADGSGMTAIDSALSAISTNPLTNAALATALSNISSPPLQNFHVHLTKAGASDAAVVVTSRNDFGVGGATGDAIQAPVTGIYMIHYEADSTLLINGQGYPITGSQISYTSTISLQANTVVSLQPPSKSELFVGLLKPDETLPG